MPAIKVYEGVGDLNKTKDLLFALSVIAFAAVMYLETFNFPPRSKFHTFAPTTYPRIFIYTLFVLAGFLLVTTIFKMARSGGFKFSFEGLKRILSEKKETIAVFIIFGLYLLIMRFLGFIVASMIFLFFTQWFLQMSKKASIVKIIAVSVIATMSTHYIFKYILHVYLPKMTIL